MNGVNRYAGITNIGNIQPVFSAAVEGVRSGTAKKVQSMMMYGVIGLADENKLSVKEIIALVHARDLTSKLELRKLKHLVQFILSKCKSQEDIDALIDYFNMGVFQGIDLSSANQDYISQSAYSYGARIQKIPEINEMSLTFPQQRMPSRPAKTSHEAGKIS